VAEAAALRATEKRVAMEAALAQASDVKAKSELAVAEAQRRKSQIEERAAAAAAARAEADARVAEAERIKLETARKALAALETRAWQEQRAEVMHEAAALNRQAAGRAQARAREVNFGAGSRSLAGGWFSRMGGAGRWFLRGRARSR
jgi:hypothetical protein